MINQDKQLLGFVMIALAAVLTIYLTAMPANKTSPTSDDLNASMIANIKPAAGDIAPGGVGSVPEDASVLEKGQAYSVVQIFATQQECKAATSTACYFVNCEDVTAVENACEADEKTGWRPVVPAADKTAIPDVIAPPAEMTTE